MDLKVVEFLRCTVQNLAKTLDTKNQDVFKVAILPKLTYRRVNWVK
jgi:hypothetical protein